MDTSAKPIARRILGAIIAASNALVARKPDPDAALELLLPYQDLELIEGLPEQRSRNLLHLVCSVVGDAYREARKPNEAAWWYRRASEFRRDGGYINYYVDVVLQHRLDAHYEHALACLRAANNAWSETPLHWRILGHVLSFWQRIKRPWTMKPYHELRHRAKDFEETLKTRITGQR